jgi:glycerophosphoryl diester phosphodiesterase
MIDLYRQHPSEVLIVGHRGAPDCAPENTMASFREGIRQGANIIELDVRLSADRRVVVFHDETLDRTTDGSGPLVEQTLADLQSLDAGQWYHPRFAGETIPTLDEVLAWARDNVPLFIELKHSGVPTPELGEQVVQLITTHRMTDQAMVISFAHQALKWIKEHSTAIATGALYYEPGTDPITLAQDLGAGTVLPLWHLITSTEVARCHNEGLFVSTWGQEADYAALIAMGVDCVSADHPAEVRQQFFRTDDE